MRKLLLFFAFVLTAIGVKAYTLDLTKTWTADDNTTEKVAKITLESAGELTAALADLNSQMTDYAVLYISNGAGFDLTSEDIAALSTVTCATLDLQNLYGNSGHHAPFTFANGDIKRVILPDYWDKAAVRAAAEVIIAGNANFECALSQHGNQNQSTADAKLVAYVQKPGSLYLGMRHTYFNGRADNKMGEMSGTSLCSDKLGYVSIMGNICARDISTGASTTPIAVKYDANGHFVFDKEADETSTEYGAALGGGPRSMIGTSMVGALARNNTGDLIQLDLGDAIIDDQWNADLTLSMCGIIGNRTKEIIFPTCSSLKTIPADCLNYSLPLLEEICIPGNIEYIKTRSFWISNQVLRHIWTTGTTEHMRYDNGAYLHDDHDTPDHYGHAPLDDPNWNNGKGKQDPARYGTITLPENLKLIESHCFTARSVSDVYVLNKTAPECHVDAFSTIMYMGNNTIDTQYTANQGMVTRWSYAQGDADAEYICFLHYPRESGTPDIQRFTDPTREYSVATTWRDGKGNVVYFPNQSEFNRAYMQGTTGYLWFAWDSERIPDMGNNGDANSFKNVNPSISTGASTATQRTANGYYEANTMTDPDKTDRSFYDVRLDQTGQPTLTKPADLQWYYNTIWEGKQLYPEMEYSNTETYIGQQQKMDENGKPAFVVGDCDYVQDYTMNANANGTFVENINVDANGAKVRDYSYDEDPTGGYVHEVIIAEAADGQKVIDFDYMETEGGLYYHPLVSRNWDSSKPKPWYSQTESWVECSQSEATHFLPQGYDNPGWRESMSNFANYSSWDQSKFVFLKPKTEWTEDNNNGSHYISDGWAKYTEGASDFAENINDTRYDRVQKTPITYRDYVEATDFGETRYNISDNGIRAYAGAADDEAGYTRYAKNYANTLRDYDAATDANETRYTVGSGYRAYVANANPDSWLQRYNKNYIAGSYRTFDASKDDESETRYCPDMEDVYGIVKGDTKDYRGWHQFVLHAYDTNDDRPLTPVKFYQTDNDWWTVCLPYDLKYSEMKKFFGNETSGAIPYLSKLRYVVRDYEKEKITLMFSKNLMVYKEAINNPSIMDHYVHGEIDDKTTWIGDGEGQYADEAALLAADPVILHKGVPYLIKPNIDVNAGRSFDVFKTENEDLYNRLVDVQYLDAGALETMIYMGEYTVPAYVIGDSDEATTSSRDFDHAAGPTFTYNSSDKITYGGKEVEAQISSDFSYTFVGSFFLSVLPQYCYFLGWDSNANKAAFWFNRVPNPASYDWNNQTGIICPNFNTSLQIDPATSLSDPAKWTVKASDIENDDLVGVASGAKKSLMDMDFGSIDVVVSGIGQINLDRSADKAVQEDVIYDLRGVRMNQPKSRLSKGVYIVNGKKYIVE